MSDIAQTLSQQVKAAAVEKTMLSIVGAGSRNLAGKALIGVPLLVSSHAGIVEYEPRELVITARSGTSLLELEQTLAASGQMLAFEPPRFSATSTLGGAVASGLSGPRRPYAGALRDFMLGCRIINGEGEILNFGGQVMKNVAGYDVTRLMVGAWGTLGVLLEVSLKVLPVPQASYSVVLDYTMEEALQKMRELAGKPVPIDASCYLDGHLYLRLSGSESALTALSRQLGGELLQQGKDFWRDLRDLNHPFFNGNMPLWRVSVSPGAPILPLDAACLMDWGGAQRWLRTDIAPEAMRAMVEKLGGHAMLVRGGNPLNTFHPLPAAMLALHRRVKQAFDPNGIFNRGRMYAEI